MRSPNTIARVLCFSPTSARAHDREYSHQADKAQYVYLGMFAAYAFVCVLDFSEWDIYYPRRVHNENRKIEP